MRKKPLVIATRLGWITLGAKWLVAVALVGSLWLPFTTCTANGKTQVHYLEFSRQDAQVVAWFLWPIPVLLGRTFWRVLRHSRLMVVLEILLTLGAWWIVVMSLAAGALISLGVITPAAGAELALSGLTGYLALSLLDLCILIQRGRETRPSVTPPNERRVGPSLQRRGEDESSRVPQR